MLAIEVTPDLSALDRELEQLPNSPAVFLLWPAEGEPYLSKTGVLRRRLKRLLGERAHPSRLLNLRHTVRRIECYPTGSPFESSMRIYELARRHFPKSYPDLLKLRLPPYVKIVLQNEFPRSQVTTHLGRPPALYYGPFRGRASAEAFQEKFLDLFQMRRCQEDLAPSPDHPGCIYGEMGMCLRPCQQVVGPDEYRHEVERVVEFLESDGGSMLQSIAAARDRFSEEMQFEEAARQHKRYEKVQEVLTLRDELVREVERLHGVAATASTAPDAVELWPVRAGRLLPRVRLSFEVVEGKPVSLDAKLREVFAALADRPVTIKEREEHLALLARWYYSSWRQGEWLAFDSFERVPYRRLVHAVSKVKRG